MMEPLMKGSLSDRAVQVSLGVALTALLIAVSLGVLYLLISSES